MKSLSQRLLTMSAAGVIIAAAGTVHAEQSQHQQTDTAIPEFSQLDMDGDQALDAQELESVAQSQQQEAESLITEYDGDNSQTIDQQEYDQLTQSLQQGSQQEQISATGANASGQADIEIQQEPAQVTVQKPAPEVTIEQAEPEVEVTTREPDVQVQQGEPEVSVQQPEPQVSVNQPQPEVDVETAEPDVSVTQQEPQVNVETAEPDVEVVSEQGQQDTQQQVTEQQASTQEMTQGSMDESLLSASVNDLRSTEVVDSNGNAIGQVEEVAIRRDGSEIGFIIDTAEPGEEEPNFVYAPANATSLEGDQLVISDSPDLGSSREFRAEDYTIAPDSDSPLNQLLETEQVTQR